MRRPLMAGCRLRQWSGLRRMEHLMSKKTVRGDGMQGTQRLHDAGQSLWLDNITRDLLNNGTLKRYIDELSITGLTSNPTIFDHAIKNSTAYDAAISQKAGQTSSAEELFFELALEDLSRAAELFRPIHEKTNGVDGWVSLEVSPLLAHDTARTLAAAKALFERANLPNLLIKIPGTKEGLPAIEETIFSGVAVNVNILFYRDQYLAAVEASLQLRRPASASALGQYWDEESRCFGDSLHQSPGSTVHGKYHAGRDAESSGRSFQVRRFVTRRRRQ